MGYGYATETSRREFYKVLVFARGSPAERNKLAPIKNRDFIPISLTPISLTREFALSRDHSFRTCTTCI